MRIFNRTKKVVVAQTKCEFCGSRKVMSDAHGETRCGDCLRLRKRALDKMETK